MSSGTAPRLETASTATSAPATAAGPASAASTCGGTGVGPGVNRYFFCATAERLVAALDALLAFAAALIALRLAGGLARRWRAARRPELLLWAWSLAAYAVSAAAIA